MSTNGALLVFAGLLVGLGAGCIAASSARGEEDCLAAPSGRPPGAIGFTALTTSNSESAGWHLPTQGQVQSGAVVAQPATVPSVPKPDQNGHPEQGSTTSPALGESSVQGSIQQDDAGANAAARLDPPAATAPDNTAWPDPPTSSRVAGPALPDHPAPMVAEKVEEPAAFNQNIGRDSGSERQNTTAIAIARSVIPIGVLLLLTIGLVMTGISLRRLGKASMPNHDSTQASPLNVRFAPTRILAKWSEGFFASSRASASSAACSDLSLICRSPSTASSPRQTSIPNLRLDRRPKTRARRCQTGKANVRSQSTSSPQIRVSAADLQAPTRCRDQIES